MLKTHNKILKNLPRSPGIYKMIDKDGKIIYIGKAKDLKKRIRQYFQKNYEHSTRTKKLLENVEDIKIIAVDSDLEAIILEHNLIKEFKPKYNVIMKDDKNYVYIKITNEDFPRIQIVRRVEKDNAKYIGPKTAAHKVEDTLRILKNTLLFRHCGLDIKFTKENLIEPHNVEISKKTIKYPCLDFYTNRCIGPCIGKCTPEEYKKIIINIESFFSGKADEIFKTLREQMNHYAGIRNFEKAAKTRDKIKKLEDILEKQKVSDPNQEDKDIINYCVTQGKAYFNLFQIRGGKLIGQENFTLSALDVDENSQNQEILEEFLKQYYELATDIPKEILIPHNLENEQEIKNFVDKVSAKKIHFLVPKQGIKDRLLEMSLNNARIFADRQKFSWRTQDDLTENAAKDLKKLLRIKNDLKRIECYDISHLSGTETVGSMIVFFQGVPKQSHYRKFKLRTIENKPDDYKSMEELLTRRFSKIALQVQQKDYEFRSSTKKDKNFIEKNNKVNLEKTDRDFYVLKKNIKQLGFIGIKKHSDKVSELRNLWVLKSERGKKLGYKLINEAIKKSKTKRVYAICRKKLKDYYLMLGFEEIKKTPEELNERYSYCQKKYKNMICLLYDKNKHKPDESFSKIPDLVVIDGGKGQLSVANKIFAQFKLDIPHIALAKEMEEIFTPGKANSIKLPSNNEALKLIQRARNEAHRFAISFNQQLRTKKMFESGKTSS